MVVLAFIDNVFIVRGSVGDGVWRLSERRRNDKKQKHETRVYAIPGSAIKTPALENADRAKPPLPPDFNVGPIEREERRLTRTGVFIAGLEHSKDAHSATLKSGGAGVRALLFECPAGVFIAEPGTPSMRNDMANRRSCEGCARGQRLLGKTNFDNVL